MYKKISKRKSEARIRGCEDMFKLWIKCRTRDIDQLHRFKEDFIGKRRITEEDLDYLQKIIMKSKKDIDALSMDFNRVRGVYEKRVNISKQGLDYLITVIK